MFARGPVSSDRWSVVCGVLSRLVGDAKSQKAWSRVSRLQALWDSVFLG
jgi:hypothetical protein